METQCRMFTSRFGMGWLRRDVPGLVFGWITPRKGKTIFYVGLWLVGFIWKPREAA